MRTIVIGDIHGCYDELVALLAKVELADDDRLVSVGDVVDRGPQPREVVAFLRARPNTVTLVGNHERKHVRGVMSYAQEITKLQLGDTYADAVAWMRTLPYWFEDAHVRVVHAAMVPGLPLPAQPEEILCGSTKGERELEVRVTGRWYEHYDDAKPVVFGHHVVEAPLVHRNAYGIDTGACHGGALTALVAPSMTLVQVAAPFDHWAAVKQVWQLPVLRGKPWRELPWTEIAELADRFRAGSPWIAELEAWVEALRALAGPIREAARREAARLAEGGDFTAAARAHPAAALLFQSRSGRLDDASVARVLTTPHKVIELATALGLSAPPFP